MADNAFANREPASKPSPPGSEQLKTPVVSTDGSAARGDVPAGESIFGWGGERLGRAYPDDGPLSHPDSHSKIDRFAAPKLQAEDRGGVHDGSGRESTVKSALDAWPNPSFPPVGGGN